TQLQLSPSYHNRHNRNHRNPPRQPIIPANPDPAGASHERAKESYIPSNQPHPWEKQPRESIPAWRAFETFLQLSVANPHREVSYGEVSAAIAKNKSLISRWARQVRNGLTWKHRADAWLATIDRA